MRCGANRKDGIHMSSEEPFDDGVFDPHQSGTQVNMVGNVGLMTAKRGVTKFSLAA